MGQNGFGSTDCASQVSPKLLETLVGKGVVQVACGWSHSVVLLENGAVWAYGSKTGTGFPSDTFKPQPTIINEKTGVKLIACGHHHSAALTFDGKVLTWGTNLRGQLGHGNTIDVEEPKVISSLLTTMSLSRLNDDAANPEDNSGAVTNQPVKHSGKSNPVFIVDVVCGANATVCLTEEGHIFTWGSGDHGFLGHNDTQDEYNPKIVKDLLGTDIVLIAAGDNHMFACTDVETYSWGWNGLGQLGLGSEEDQLRPAVVDVLRNSRVSSISAGAAHSACTAESNGKLLLYTWGSNTCGQLGQGKKKKLLKPTVVSTFAEMDVVEVKCGSFHTLAHAQIKGVESCVWATGYNKFGQLGLNSTADSDECKKLTSVLKGKDIKMLACGGLHSAVCVARQWVEDKEAKECMGCKSAFTFTNRKHHCRNCFGVFCGNCSKYKAAILRSYNTEPVRVCGVCYTKLSGREAKD
jgi:alpha-tubulin suppressor-like RCC1 family protein